MTRIVRGGEPLGRRAVRTPEFEMIAETEEALRYGLSEICHKVVRLIDSEVWQDFTWPDSRRFTFDTFAEFVESPYGLETTMGRLDWLAMAADYKPLEERLEAEERAR